VKYEKPELVGKASAVDSIQQIILFDKSMSIYLDVFTIQIASTITPLAAYEADE
jgi:hypothetical protein